LILGSARRGGIWYSIVTSKKGLVACGFSNSKETAEQSAIHSLPNESRGNLTRSSNKSGTIGILHQIRMGKHVNRRPELAFTAPSEFMRRVYETTISIPKGKVITYGELARLVGHRKAARAVGNAMAKNPLPLVIPCHRVVRSTLKVGSYGFERNGRSRTKRALLENEGARFDGERVSKDCVWHPS
jgi:O-6-methylguanine DNA methyltransferase